MADPNSPRAVKKAQKKTDKANKKAAQKDFDRRHAQLKRTQTMHGVLLAAQVKRAKTRDKKVAKQNAS